MRSEIVAACATHGFLDFMTEKGLLDAVSQATVADVQVYQLIVCSRGKSS